MSYTKETRFDMPNGEVFRTRTARRYVVVDYIAGLAKWQADYRTDVESRAVAKWRENTRRSYTSCIVDTTTGEVIR